MSKRFLLITLSFVLVVALVFTGCAPARRPYDNTNNRTGTRTGYTGTGTGTGTNNAYGPGTGYGTNTGTGYGTTGYGSRYGTTTGTGMGNGTTGTGTGYGTTGTGTGYGTTNTGTGIGANVTTSTSDRIATAVRQIQGVQNATAVVTGNTAYVGVTLSGTTGTATNTATTTTTANAADIKRRVSQMVRAADTAITTVYVSTDAGFMNRLRTVDQGIRSGRPLSGFTTELRNLITGITPAR